MYKIICHLPNIRELVAAQGKLSLNGLTFIAHQDASITEETLNQGDERLEHFTDAEGYSYVDAKTLETLGDFKSKVAKPSAPGMTTTKSGLLIPAEAQSNPGAKAYSEEELNAPNFTIKLLTEVLQARSVAIAEKATKAQLVAQVLESNPKV